jgi:thioredoxin reductase (NADPH)
MCPDRSESFATRPAAYLETNMPEVFTEGDVPHGSLKRCASAIGGGATAIAFVQQYLAGG